MASDWAVPGRDDDREKRKAINHIRPDVLAIPESGIVEIYNYGRNRQGLVPLWVGESDLPAPPFVVAAASRSLEAGETFYTYQGGIPDLRAAIADHITARYGEGRRFVPERFFVTVGGMQALQIAIHMIAGPGDTVLVPTPAWPNFGGAVATAGARMVEVPMRLDGGVRWSLDLDALAAAVTPATRGIVINSPSNPLGWTATEAELRGVLDLARRHGLWIIADEIYGLFVFDGPRAPSFHDIMDDDDLILFPQTLSKNWAMTGLRVGWLEAPPALGPTIENLVQYSTSGVPVPLQRAAAAGIRGGDGFIAAQIARARANRDILCDALAATGKVTFARPPGAFYLFCQFAGHPDDHRLAFRLVDEAGVGVAPGRAFGAGGDGFLRLCFARDPEQIREVSRRLVAWLDENA